ncbi:MAG TPA: thioredoxin family protein, partial [Polyangiaceae bacterium]
LASQLAAKQLNQALHTHRPRINAAAVVLEAAKYAPLADVFRSSLQLSYPVAIADLATLAQNSTLGEVRSVPTVIIFDAQGREVLRKYGAFSSDELEGWLTRAR